MSASAAQDPGGLTRADVEVAAVRIAGRVRATPVLHDGDVVFKLEHLQHTGSFKPRGAFNRVLSAAESGELGDAGVIAVSGGNAGLAFAYAARALGVPAEVYLPQVAPAVKVAKLRALGATVVRRGELVEAYEAARDRQTETGAVFCHPYDQPEVVAGQGTLALELPEVDTVLVAVGGGGLMAGIAAALEGGRPKGQESGNVSGGGPKGEGGGKGTGRARVVGVEPTGCPTLYAALEAGARVDVAVGGIAADSLGAQRIGEIAFEVATRCGVESLLVGEEAVVAARRELWHRYRIIVEHGAATPWAALASGAYRPAAGERVAVILCGGNTDPTDLG